MSYQAGRGRPVGTQEWRSRLRSVTQGFLYVVARSNNIYDVGLSHQVPRSIFG
jgi:hypothetical protein